MRAVSFDIVLKHVVAVVLAGDVGAGGKRQTQRQVVTGNGTDRGVGFEVERQAAILAAHPAVRIQPVAVIVGRFAALFRDRPGIGDAEMLAQGVAAHGPVEGTAELWQVEGRCQ